MAGIHTYKYANFKVDLTSEIFLKIDHKICMLQTEQVE